MSKVQTDNSFLFDKIMLRINNLPLKNEIYVLDCFAGEGKIWNYIKNKIKKKFYILSIDKKNFNKIYLKGDNLKYLKNLPLEKFDVIDFDAYGVPYNQLKIIFQKKINAVVFITFIQSLYGGLPINMLEEIGYNKNMIKKIPTLFFKNGLKKFKLFLAQNGVKKIKIRSFRNKHYLCFQLKKGGKNESNLSTKR